VGVCGDRVQSKPHFAREEPFCGSKTLCLEKLGKTRNLLAKRDVDNVGAGRAAKGASPGRSAGSLFRRYAPYCLNQK